MSTIITKSNLEQVRQENSLIRDEILNYVNDFTERFNKSGIKGQEKQAFSVLT